MVQVDGTDTSLVNVMQVMSPGATTFPHKRKVREAEL